MVILNAMTQYQVLSTSGRTDWVSLNKAEPVESTFECRGLEKTAGDGKAAQIIQRNQHDSNLAKVFAAISGDDRITIPIGNAFPYSRSDLPENWPGAILPSEASAVDGYRVATRKSPQAQPNRSGDKETCFQESPRE
jgi:hypothetical protein